MTRPSTPNHLVALPEPGILFTWDNAMWAYHALRAAREAGTAIPEQAELCDELEELLFSHVRPGTVGRARQTTRTGDRKEHDD